MSTRIAVLMCILLMLTSVIVGIDSLCRTRNDARCDVEQALTQTLLSCPDDEITTDTIRVFRDHIAQTEIRDAAYLALEWREDRHGQPVMVAHTGLTIWTLWLLSDQRASGILASLAALWLMLGLWLKWRKESEVAIQNCCVVANPGGSVVTGNNRLSETISLGRLRFDVLHNRFYADGHELRFTPMQHQLMELFFRAPGHQMDKNEICEHLWPRKPDANDTLYTLIRRIKPIIEGQSDLRIECERGRSYTLKANQV